MEYKGFYKRVEYFRHAYFVPIKLYFSKCRKIFQAYL